MAKKLKLNSLSKKSASKDSPTKLSTPDKKLTPKPTSKLAGSRGLRQNSMMGDDNTDTNYKFGQFGSSRTADAATTEKPSGIVSKPVRFSDRNKVMNSGDNSIFKIIIFIVVIVAVGMGLIYFVLNFGQGQGGNNANSSTSSAAVVQPTLRPGVEVYNALLPDSESDGTVDNDFFTDAEISLGSEKNAGDDVVLEKLIYKPFISFTRVEFNMSGVDLSAPAVEVSSEDNQVTVSFTNVDVAAEEMLNLIVPKAGPFISIVGDQTDAGVDFTLTSVEPLLYYASINSNQDTLTIDFKTELQMETETVISSSESTETTSTQSETSESSSSASKTSSASSTSSKTSSATSTTTGAQKLTNTRSINDQTIVNPNVNSNGVIMERYFYADFGPYFEMNFEFKGSGIKSVPNVTAEMINVNGVDYIEVILSDVQFDFFYGNGIAETTFPGVDTTYSNLKKVIFKGKDGNTYKYWFELGYPDEYRLTATEVSEEGRRQVKFEIFD